VTSDGKRLFVADTNNSRVMVWDSLPTQVTPADSVIGQTSFAGVSVNAGGALSAQALSYATLLFAQPGRLFIADGNSRVLIAPTY
jgi:hypothetical protein